MCPPPSPEPGPVEEAPADVSRLLKGIRGDEELLARLIANFLSDCPARMAGISAALEVGDGGALERAAHALAGGLTVFSSAPALERVRRLETLGRHGRVDEARALLPEAEEAVAAVVSFLQAYLGGR